MSNNLEIIRAEGLFFNPTPPDGRESIVEAMIPQGLTLLSGDPKSCKSWMMLDLKVLKKALGSKRVDEMVRDAGRFKPGKEYGEG